jgi:chemotaxis protein CheZ
MAYANVEQADAGSAEVAQVEILGGKIDDLRRFVDRRFAELSAEIHASVQLIDFSETNLSEQLAGVKSQIAEVLAVPQVATRNSGNELEAVVQTTEAAANRIMEAAEAISDWLTELRADPALRDRISEKVNAIFEACSFQDLTSQRIRRAIDHLHHVESVLNNIGSSEPTEIVAPPQPTAPAGTADLAQEEIDRLLAG